MAVFTAADFGIEDWERKRIPFHAMSHSLEETWACSEEAVKTGLLISNW